MKFNYYNFVGLTITLSKLAFFTYFKFWEIESDFVIKAYFFSIAKKMCSVISCLLKVKPVTLLLTSLVIERLSLNIGYRVFGEKSSTIPTVSQGKSANDSLRGLC